MALDLPHTHMETHNIRATHMRMRQGQFLKPSARCASLQIIQFDHWENIIKGQQQWWQPNLVAVTLILDIQNLSLRMKITWKNKSLYFQWDFITWCNVMKTIWIFNTPWKCHENHLQHWTPYENAIKTIWKAFSCSLSERWPFENVMNFAYSVAMYILATTHDVYLDTLN